MSTVSKKRKISAVTTSKTSSAALTQSITTFGRISKSGKALQTVGKDGATGKVLQDIGQSISIEGVRKKRRIQELETPPKEELYTIFWEKKSTFTTQHQRSSNASASSPSLPPVPRKKVPPRAKNTDTPTKGIRAFLEAFAVSSSPASSFRDSSPLPSRDTPPTSPISARSPCPTREASIELSDGLPEVVTDLINLHSSFLTALSLHYAHNGSFAPADLRILRPSIERAWKKRRIFTEDIQRVLGILGNDTSATQQTATSCPISLSNYGNGKICVELCESTPDTRFRRQPVDVEKLNDQFESNIHHYWQHQSSPDIPAFIATLPLAPITVCASLSKISPLLAKGQTRLTDLKAGAIHAQLSAASPLKSTSVTPSTRPKAVQSRSSSLLSRIQAKELHQSTLPLPPSAETVARRNALQRLDEVIPVLELLITSGSRSRHNGALEEAGGNRLFSFTMPTVVQHLQMSLRNPISKEEAGRCIGLLAAEIAPGWIGVREVGKLKGVTVRSVKGFGREEMGERIKIALGKQ
ncbi:hypothetical protein MMC30_006739 [Trapelia coarctata]|nr:hypothetical protein [Trapelia coarctata]